MLQTGRVTRHNYNAKPSYTLHEGTLQRQAEYCNKVGYQPKLTFKTNTSDTLQDGKLRRQAAYCCKAGYQEKLNTVTRQGTNTYQD